MIFNFLKKTSPKTQRPKEELIKKLLSDTNHAWLLEDKNLKRAIVSLVSALKDKHAEFFLKHETFFIQCQAHLSCAIGKTGNHHLILVFPDLVKILRSASPDHGIAILAHELGHIYYQHTENKVETLKAQIEADDFAFELGYGEELQEILLDYADSVDCRVRISKLTAKLISQKHQSR